MVPTLSLQPIGPLVGDRIGDVLAVVILVLALVIGILALTAAVAAAGGAGSPTGVHVSPRGAARLVIEFCAENQRGPSGASDGNKLPNSAT